MQSKGVSRAHCSPRGENKKPQDQTSEGCLGVCVCEQVDQKKPSEGGVTSNEALQLQWVAWALASPPATRHSSRKLTSASTSLEVKPQLLQSQQKHCTSSLQTIPLEVQSIEEESGFISIASDPAFVCLHRCVSSTQPLLGNYATIFVPLALVCLLGNRRFLFLCVAPIHRCATTKSL